MWTTNFDGLIVRAAHQNRLTPIEINLDNVDRIYRNQSSKELLTIALHGDYKNMIVIGYSGRDKSLMDALKETFTKKGSGRLYWCGYGETINSEVSELLLTIRASGREAYYVATDGFDKTMIHLSKSAFEDNPIISLQIDETLKDISENELHKVIFILLFFPKRFFNLKSIMEMKNLGVFCECLQKRQILVLFLLKRKSLH